MADDIRLFTSLLGHPKLRKLERRIGKHQARSVLTSLWLRARTDRPDGRLHGWSHEDVAIACDWDDDPEAFVAHLIDAGWLDRGPDGCLVVHGWAKRQGYATGERSRAAINRTNSLRRWLYRAGFDKATVGAMSPSEIEATWNAIGCNGNANGCESHSGASESECPLPAPSPIPLPSPIPPPLPSPTPAGGDAKGPKPQDPPPLETEAEDLVASFALVAKRRGKPWVAPQRSMAALQLAERALIVPSFRAGWRDVLQILDTRGPPAWWTTNLGLAAFCRPENFERFATGEFVGDTARAPTAEEQQDRKRREREAEDAESERLRAEVRAKRAEKERDHAKRP